MIGGEYYFSPSPVASNSLASMLNRELGTIEFYSTGRDALYSLLFSLSQKNIYLPDLICHSVNQACVSAGKKGGIIQGWFRLIS